MEVGRRTCDDCNECCFVLGVRELEKVPFCECKRDAKHYKGLRHIGCGRYEDRPDSCKAFSCMWLEGLGAPEWKPSKIGVVFEAVVTSRIGKFIQVSARSDAAVNTTLMHDAVNFYINVFGADAALVKLPGGVRRILGPPDKTAKLIEALEKLRKPTFRRAKKNRRRKPEL